MSLDNLTSPDLTPSQINMAALDVLRDSAIDAGGIMVQISLLSLSFGKDLTALSGSDSLVRSHRRPYKTTGILTILVVTSIYFLM